LTKTVETAQNLVLFLWFIVSFNDVLNAKMPLVLVPLSSHIFLQLWAAHFAMQNLLLYVCLCICTCSKLKTWEHVRYRCHSMTNLPKIPWHSSQHHHSATGT